MVKPEAFLAIEASVAGTINSSLSKVTATAVAKLQPLLDEGKWDDAHEVANRLSLNGVVEVQRRRLEELAVTALLFGAQNVTGSPATTSFARGTQQLPWALQQALDQLTEMVETLGGEQLRTSIHKLTRSQEVMPVEKTELRKFDQTFADQLNAAVLGTGKVVVDMAANLTTSRLVTLGFLSEAMEAKVETYQVNEVLDSRTCAPCQYMHGKTFNVSQEYSRILSVLGTSDPKELKAMAPWPSASQAGLRDLNSMTLDQMQAAGFASPPYHPLCRGMLAMTGAVTETIPLHGMATKKLVQQIIEGAVEDTGPVVVPMSAPALTLDMVTDGNLRGLIRKITDKQERRAAIQAFVDGNLAGLKAILVAAGLDPNS